MESTHGQLSAWLPNGLCSNNTNSLTDIHLMPTRQISTITLSTDTMASFACNNRAYNDSIHARSIKNFNLRFFKQDTCIQNNFTNIIDYGLCQYSSKHTIRQFFNNISSFNHSLDLNTSCCTTIILSNHHILSHIN